MTPVKCLYFYDKPYIREYVATEARIIVWRTDFPQHSGGTKQGCLDPMTKPHRQKSLYAYAVGRLRAIQLANGEGRIDDEKGPGGGTEPKFIRTKIGNNPLSGYLTMLFYLSLMLRSLLTGVRNGRQLKALAPSR